MSSILSNSLEGTSSVSSISSVSSEEDIKLETRSEKKAEMKESKRKKRKKVRTTNNNNNSNSSSSSSSSSQKETKHKKTHRPSNPSLPSSPPLSSDLLSPSSSLNNNGGGGGDDNNTSPSSLVENDLQSQPQPQPQPLHSSQPQSASSSSSSSSSSSTSKDRITKRRKLDLKNREKKRTPPPSSSSTSNTTHDDDDDDDDDDGDDIIIKTRSPSHSHSNNNDDNNNDNPGMINSEGGDNNNNNNNAADSINNNDNDDESKHEVNLKNSEKLKVFSNEWIADPEKRRQIQLQLLSDSISSCSAEKVNEYNEKGETLLMQAAALRSIEMVNTLLNKGANPNLQNSISKETALHFAVGEGNLEITKLLIEHGADVSLIDLMGFNCLHVACFCSSLKGKSAEEMFQILVENGIPIDAPDSTRKSFAPLHFLCSISHAGEYDDAGDQDHVLGLVKLICEKLNADPCVRNSSNSLPLHLSAERGHEKVCEFLLSRINLTINENEFTDIINSVDTAGNSPLHLAIIKKRESVIELFRSYPFNWELKNNNNDTPNQLYDSLLQAKSQKKIERENCFIL